MPLRKILSVLRKILFAVSLPPILIPMLAAAAPLSNTSVLGFQPSPIVWEDCNTPEGIAIKCSNLEVPMDWNNPSGSKITLFMNMLPAKNPEQRIGYLFYNPGGPGMVASRQTEIAATGVDTLFSEELQQRFDILGWDIRGSGKSNPVRCDFEIWNKIVEDTPTVYPATEDEYNKLVSAYGDLGRSCLEKTGESLHYVDTLSTIKDLEATRIALGGEPITYHGTSGGSQLGSQYAQLFPNNIRALMLDANIDHSLDPKVIMSYMDIGISAVLEHFLAWADTNETSALQGMNASQFFDDLIKAADEQPIPAPECVAASACRSEMTGALIREGRLSDFGWGRTHWPRLAQGLLDAKNGNATGLSYNSDVTQFAAKENHWQFANIAITCQDYNVTETWGEYQTRQHLGDSLLKHGNLQNPMKQWTVLCQKWPTAVTNPQAPLHVSSPSAPILMVNSLWDPSLGYPMAVNMVSKIDGAVLLTRNGDGHGSGLVIGETRDAMNRYLLDVEVPKPGTMYNS